MATTSKAAVELAERPYMSLRGVYVSVGKLKDLSAMYQGATRLGVRLFNPGKVRIVYEVVEMSASVSGHVEANPVFETRTGVLHPEEEATYFYPLIKTVQPIQAPTDGEISLRLRYWAIEAEKKSQKAKFRIILTSQTTHEWLFLDGPTYTE